MPDVRVLRIITRLNIGGPAHHALLLTSALARRGFRSELVAGVEGPREGAILPPDGEITRIPTLKRTADPVAAVRTARALTRLVRARRPQIVHTHMAMAGALGRLAARRAGVPVIVHTFHGHVLSGYFLRPVSKAFVAAERRLARWTDALVSISPAVRDELLSFGIGRPGQWHVIPIGLPLDGLLAGTPSTQEARLRLGLPPAGPVVGIVGRLVPIKDHSTFLEAAARVARRRPDATFVVAGDGELRVPLEARARSILGERVRFLGWVRDLPALYGSLDVVVLTSRNEGTPAALIEAGAAARPAVATRVGGVPEVVRDGATGLLVPPGDPEAVAASVLALLEQGERARALGAAARAWVGGRFSADRLADDVAALYTELLARRGIAAPRV